MAANNLKAVMGGDSLLKKCQENSNCLLGQRPSMSQYSPIPFLVALGLGYFTLAVIMTLFCLVGDHYLEKLPEDSYHLRALVDSSVHSTVGGISWLMVLLLVACNPPQSIGNNNLVLEVAAAFLLAGAVDIDHFLLARSLHIKDAFHLPHRPPFHCTSALLLCFAFLLTISLLICNEHLFKISWILLTSVLSHHIRDANRRGIWLAPFGSTPPLSQPVYINFLVWFPALAALLINLSSRALKTKMTRDILIV